MRALVQPCDLGGACWVGVCCCVQQHCLQLLCQHAFDSRATRDTLIVSDCVLV